MEGQGDTGARRRPNYSKNLRPSCKKYLTRVSLAILLSASCHVAMEDTGSSEILMLVAPMAESARHAVAGVRMEDLFRGLHRLHCVVAQACAYLRVFHAGVLRVRAEACRWFTTLLNVQLDFFGECLLVRHVEVLHVRGARVCRWSSSSWMCSSASLARSLSTRHAMTHSCWRCNRRGFSIIDQKVGCGDLHDVFSKL